MGGQQDAFFLFASSVFVSCKDMQHQGYATCLTKRLTKLSFQLARQSFFGLLDERTNEWTSERTNEWPLITARTSSFHVVLYTNKNSMYRSLLVTRVI